MRNHVLAAALATALAAMPAAAVAYPAVAARDVNLRAGPARDYPVVAVVALGAPLEVLGCLNGYTWCDAIAGPYRGWVWAGNLSAAWQGGYVPLPGYGAVIGIGVIGFLLDPYWHEHYRDRPWYPERQRWTHRPPPAGHAMPPPGPHAPAMPPPGHRPPAMPPPGPRGPAMPPPGAMPPPRPMPPPPRAEPPRHPGPPPHSAPEIRRQAPEHRPGPQGERGGRGG